MPRTPVRRSSRSTRRTEGGIRGESPPLAFSCCHGCPTLVDCLWWVAPIRGAAARMEVFMSPEVDTLPDDIEAGEPEAGVHAGITVSAPASKVWEHLISPDGTEELLGQGARLGNKGEPWHAADGSYGVVRSFHPVEQVRVTWHPHEDGPLSMLDIQ